ncbi:MULTISPECIES: SH3 domain-containing protein [unclassified Bradyrhizobium]|uniref:SH3 domain-containing protein n=1 Tax=unclassified Bradyrhizobium TaxID=2631580 RepID=UPI001CD4AE8C|nr:MULTISPECIES: SH3 domain-containing protein [unclassified Bradyrhizobium]MCA1428124.1 SH3 domain-containing protein [Bradyrhizobium sp. NBAIM16]MCA1505127.1 SH3 domain-containing protein [Bradyrhizobium sp. NBAIM02]
MRALLLIAAAVLSAVAQAARAGDSEPAWRASALALVPAGYVAGTAYRTEGSTGYLAVYPATSNDPKTPGSVFAARQVLVVTLTADATRATSAELKPRTGPAPDNDDNDFAGMHAELAAKRAKLPAGTEPCDLGAWSVDKDSSGLNVRAEPSIKARVLGTLPPPYRLRLGGAENTPEGGWLTEFRIIGFRDGWFLIEDARPPGKDYEDETRYPRSAPRPYAGRGWVASNKVGANYANGTTRMGGLFQAPFIDAKWMPAQRELGGPLDTDGGPKRIFACSGLWGLVESHDGVRGWWRALCSNQVTNCS